MIWIRSFRGADVYKRQIRHCLHYTMTGAQLRTLNGVFVIGFSQGSFHLVGAMPQYKMCIRDRYWYGEGSLAEIRAELPKKNYLGDPEP